MGDYAAAETALRRSVEVFSKAVGPEHRRTAMALLGLGEILTLRGRGGEAEAVLRKCVAIRRAQLKPNDPGITEAEESLAEARKAAPHS